jgi:hypothetical protein
MAGAFIQRRQTYLLGRQTDGHRPFLAQPTPSAEDRFLALTARS